MINGNIDQLPTCLPLYPVHLVSWVLLFTYCSIFLYCSIDISTTQTQGVKPSLGLPWKITLSNFKSVFHNVALVSFTKNVPGYVRTIDFLLLFGYWQILNLIPSYFSVWCPSLPLGGSYLVFSIHCAYLRTWNMKFYPFGMLFSLSWFSQFLSFCNSYLFFLSSQNSEDLLFNTLRVLMYNFMFICGVIW